MNQPAHDSGLDLLAQALPTAHRPTTEAESAQQVKVPAIEKICQVAILQGASDIHLAAGRRPLLRLNGSLKELDTVVLSGRALQSIFESIATDPFRNALNTEGQADFAFTLNTGGSDRAFRVNAVKSLHGIALTMRLVSDVIPDPMKIGLTSQLLQKIKHGTGIFLATGATGSGKSTTLASIVQWLADTTDLKIVSVEQPIEYRFNHGKSLIVQREVPSHARSFADTLRSMLRQDPDVIMVGELRDLAEIRVALQAAESGHLVLSTVHTNSAAESVNRLVDVFPGEEQELVKVMLSQCLLGIISQDLIPRQNGQGRVLAYELMLNNPAISNLIRQGQPQKIDSTIQTSRKEGMHTFDDHIVRLCNAGVIDRAHALQYARKPTDIAASLPSTPPTGLHHS